MRVFFALLLALWSISAEAGPRHGIKLVANDGPTLGFAQANVGSEIETRTLFMNFMKGCSPPGAVDVSKIDTFGYPNTTLSSTIQMLCEIPATYLASSVQWVLQWPATRTLSIQTGSSVTKVSDNGNCTITGGSASAMTVSGSNCSVSRPKNARITVPLKRLTLR